MAIDAPSSTFFSPWPDRLRHSAIILLAAALALAALVAFGELSLLRAAAVFVCIAAAALVPWRLRHVVTSREDVRGVNQVETAVVSAIVAGMPDPAVLLDRAGRVIHLNAAAAQLAPALRKNELAQFALRSPEIITALREAIATTETRRATYLDHVPVDRWMELIVTPVPVPTLFGGMDRCMLMTFHDQTPLRRVEEMRADFIANASHELRTPLAALSGFIDTLIGSARDDPAARTRFLAIMKTQATIRDYGPGIAAEHIPRLTERFYRVDVTQSRAEGGTGLGLALVKHILNRHRGRLMIESEAGKGAMFTVRLPLIHTESVAAAQ